MRRRVKEFISPREARLATGLLPQMRFGPITIEMLDEDILLTSSCSLTFGLEREGERERERERERGGV